MKPKCVLPNDEDALIGTRLLILTREHIASHENVDGVIAFHRNSPFTVVIDRAGAEPLVLSVADLNGVLTIATSSFYSPTQIVVCAGGESEGARISAAVEGAFERQESTSAMLEGSWLSRRFGACRRRLASLAT